MVVICLPMASLTSTPQDRIAAPSMWTVQAPHCAMPQPYLVPVRPAFSRIAQSNGVSGSTSKSNVWPLMMRFAMLSLPYGLVPPSSRGRWDGIRNSSNQKCASGCWRTPFANFEHRYQKNVNHLAPVCPASRRVVSCCIRIRACRLSMDPAIEGQTGARLAKQNFEVIIVSSALARPERSGRTEFIAPRDGILTGQAVERLRRRDGFLYSVKVPLVVYLAGRLTWTR